MFIFYYYIGFVGSPRWRHDWNWQSHIKHNLWPNHDQEVQARGMVPAKFLPPVYPRNSWVIIAAHWVAGQAVVGLALSSAGATVWNTEILEGNLMGKITQMLENIWCPKNDGVPSKEKQIKYN